MRFWIRFFQSEICSKKSQSRMWFLWEWANRRSTFPRFSSKLRPFSSFCVVFFSFLGVLICSLILLGSVCPSATSLFRPWEFQTQCCYLQEKFRKSLLRFLCTLLRKLFVRSSFLRPKLIRSINCCRTFQIILLTRRDELRSSNFFVSCSLIVCAHLGSGTCFCQR